MNTNLQQLIDRAWEAVKDEPGAEAEALRALLGQSAFRIVGNSDVEDGMDPMEIAERIQARIARAYLFAKSVTTQHSGAGDGQA